MSENAKRLGDGFKAIHVAYQLAHTKLKTSMNNHTHRIVFELCMMEEGAGAGGGGREEEKKKERR